MGIRALIFLFLPFFCLCENQFSLDSNNIQGQWTVRNDNNSYSVNANVPGGIYTDLQSAGILKDFFYRFNDIDYRWVAKENWTYSVTFDAPSDVLSKKNISLVFLGLDTVGQVYLNSKLVGNFENMFVRYIFPIKDVIQEKDNILEVKFSSPITVADSLHNNQTENFYAIPPYCNPDIYHGECHVNYLRKMQASFAWDWGPAFPSVGIWKSVWIEVFDGGVIRDVTISIRKTDQNWEIQATNFLEYNDGVSNCSITTSIALNGPDGKQLRYNTHLQKSRRNVTRTFYVPEEHVSVWWPNGYGDQPLTTYQDELVCPGINEVSTVVRKIGFRTVEVIQKPLQADANGLTFYFTVNDVPIYAKGSNWIPSHVLPERGYNETTLRHLLTSAKEIHSNMIRVWGGGVYESDQFYELTDELGILVWEDFMFAVALYPSNEEFLQNVRNEVEYQVKRLQHHASIAVWAGNNENEAALRGNWWGFLQNYTNYYNDYVKLYVDTIEPIVHQLDPLRYYAVSSPSNGLQSVNEGYIAKDPYSPYYGDTHYYNYINDGWNANNFPDTRFASEYGFQSLPEYKTMAKVSELEDRNIDSDFSQSRQHHAVGYTEMTMLMKRHLPLPTDDKSEEYYKLYLYYSQISQAMSTKTETERFRRDRSKYEVTDDGILGQCMGALYWQLNDVWQAPSWSSIDFDGNWKMLHYFAKKFFAPVIVSPTVSLTDALETYVVSDLLRPVENVQLDIIVYSWSSFTPVYSNSTIHTVSGEKASLVHSADLTSFLTSSGCVPPVKKACFVYYTLKSDAADGVNSENFHLPSSLTDAVGLQKANITITDVTTTQDPRIVEIELTSDRIAPFVWLSTDVLGRFSDNGFFILQPKIKIQFLGTYTFDITELRNSLTVRSVLG